MSSVVIIYHVSVDRNVVNIPQDLSDVCVDCRKVPHNSSAVFTEGKVPTKIKKQQGE